MKFQKIFDSLKKDLPNIETWGKVIENDLINLRLIEENQTFFSQTTIYVGSSTELPNWNNDVKTTIFCCGAQTNFHVFKKAKFSIIYCGKISKSTLFNLISKIFYYNSQTAQALQLLTTNLFFDRGLQKLVSNSSMIFNNPIYVIDLQSKCLAISEKKLQINDFIQKKNNSIYISKKGLTYLNNQRIIKKAGSSTNPITFFNKLTGHSMLINKIQIDNIAVGHVLLEAVNQKFTKFDYEVLVNFSHLVALELQKQTVFNDNHGIMYSYFLIDLLKQANIQSTEITNRLKSMGFLVKDNFYIMLIPTDMCHNSDLSIQIVCKSIQNILTGCIYATYQNSIVFLISKAKYEEFSDFELKKLKKFLSVNKLKVSISNFFHHLEETPQFYNQAQTAMKLGPYMNKDLNIYYYKDYYVHHMFHLLEKENNNLRYLIHPGMMRLYYYDFENESSLLKTLRIFLAYPGQPTIISEKLHIHKNTLLYRMKKIKKISNCEFNLGKDYMNFNFSFLIIDYLHMWNHLK